MAKVFKRDGSPYYYAWINDPRAPDGLVKKSTKKTSRTAALSQAGILQMQTDDEVEAEMEQRESECGLTWLDALAIYCEQSDVRATTVKSAINIGGVVAGILGDFDLGQLTQHDLKRFVQVRRQQTVQPHKASDTGRRVMDPTIRKNLSTISAVYKVVMDLSLPNAPRRNPLKDFDRSHLKTSKKIDRHLRPTQFEEVLTACKTQVHRTMLVTLVGTGMRSGELLNLYWGEVDLKTEFIEFGNVDPDRSKTSRSRRIALLPVVVDELAAHKRLQMRAGEYDPDGLVFPIWTKDEHGKKVQKRRYDLKYLIKIVRARTKVKGYWNHGLRHTFASWALQQGMDADAIRRSLGHTTFSTTSGYAHHIDDSMAAQMRRLVLPITAQSTAQSSAFLDDENFETGERDMNTNS